MCWETVSRCCTLVAVSVSLSLCAWLLLLQEDVCLWLLPREMSLHCCSSRRSCLFVSRWCLVSVGCQTRQPQQPEEIPRKAPPRRTLCLCSSPAAAQTGEDACSSEHPKAALAGQQKRCFAKCQDLKERLFNLCVSSRSCCLSLGLPPPLLATRDGVARATGVSVSASFPRRPERHNERHSEARKTAALHI